MIRSGRRRKGLSSALGGAHDDMVAAASADMAAVEHEFFGGQAGFAGDFVELFGAADHVGPVFGGGGC